MGVGLVSQCILAGPRVVPSVEIGIRQLQTTILRFVKKFLIVFHRQIDTLNIEVLCFLIRNFEGERLEGTYFWHEPKEKRQHPRSKAGTLVAFAPFLLIARTREII